MPRPIRPQRPGAVYHVTMRGNNRGDIFFVDDDRDRFLQALSTVRHRCGWKIHAYCLMTNHYHLLIQTPSPNIAEGMQWLNSAYAHQTNTLYGRIGHVFQRRYARCRSHGGRAPACATWPGAWRAARRGKWRRGAGLGSNARDVSVTTP